MRASWRSRTVGMSLAVTAWLALGGAVPTPAAAQISDNKIRIGILGDMSGPNADAHGPGDVVAARMAVADFGGSVRGAPVEVLAGNLLGGPDIGVGIARRWFDEGVDAIFSLGNSAVAIAVQGMAADRNRITIATSAGTDVLTNKACTAVSAHWTFDTYALPVALANGILADGGKDWFFLTIDYAFGHALEAQAAKVVQAGGGRVMGNVLHPQGTSDFSGNLTQARSSGANVLGLATSGAPLTSALKQFQEFGLARTMRPAALLIDINDIHALGLDETQGLLWVTAFYWDQDEQTRAFAQRFFKLHRAMPTMFQASVYSAVMHYLRAIDAAGTDEARAVMTKMKATPIEDFMTHGARVREDGRVIRPLYLMQVKSPAESKGEWDVAKVVGTVPGEKAFRPLADSECPLVKR
ncbi:MAG: ABC transporter substrate-binding protein [Janthinobacterium lividum]